MLQNRQLVMNNSIIKYISLVFAVKDSLSMMLGETYKTATGDNK